MRASASGQPSPNFRWRKRCASSTYLLLGSTSEMPCRLATACFRTSASTRGVAMGQKINPIGFRVGINRKWRSNWFTAKLGPVYVKEDRQIRKLVQERYRGAGLADIYIERPSESNVSLTIRTARPGIIIGKGGSEIDL